MKSNIQYILICCATAIFLSCKGNNLEKSQISLNKNDSLEQVNIKDTVKINQVSFTEIISKVENNKDLTDKEYAVLLDSIFVETDEAQSEQNGYLMFTYLIDNSKRCDKVSTQLLSKSQVDRDKILTDLVALMCIDILDEDYDYNGFIKRFKLFDNNKKAEIAFNECLENK